MPATRDVNHTEGNQFGLPAVYKYSLHIAYELAVSGVVTTHLLTDYTG